MRLYSEGTLRFLTVVALAVAALAATATLARAQTPGDVQTEIIQSDLVRGEAVLRLRNGSGQNGLFVPFDYYRIRHFTVALSAAAYVNERNHVADLIVSVSTTVAAPTISLTVSGLAPNVRHLFYGQACTLPGCSNRTGFRHDLLDIPPRILPPPQNFAATSGDGYVSLSWSPPPMLSHVGEVFGYAVYMGDVRFDLPSPQAASHVFRNVPNHQPIVYRAQAINASGLGLAASLTIYAGNLAPGSPYTGHNRLRESNGHVVASAGVFIGIARPSPVGVFMPVPTDSWEFEFLADGETWTITTNLTSNVATLTVSSGLQGGVLHVIRAIAVNRFGKTRGGAGFFTPPSHPTSLLPPPQNIVATYPNPNPNRFVDVAIEPPAEQTTVQHGYWAGAYRGDVVFATAVSSVSVSALTLRGMPDGFAYRIEAASYHRGQVGVLRATASVNMPPAITNYVARYQRRGVVDLSWNVFSPVGLNSYVVIGPGGNQLINGALTAYTYNFNEAGAGKGAFVFTLFSSSRVGNGIAATATVFNLPPPQNIVANGREGNLVEVVISPPVGLAHVLRRHGHWVGAYRGGSLVATATAGVSVTRLTLRDMQNGHSYRVEAAVLFNGLIGGARAADIAYMPPAAPKNFVGGYVRHNADLINLSWERPASQIPLNNYILSGSNANHFLPGDSTSFTYQYHYSNTREKHVLTLYSSNASGSAPAVTATVLHLPPPQNVVADGSEGNRITVSIAPPTEQTPLQYGYWAGVYNGASLIATAISGVSVTKLTLRGAPNGVSYRVEAAPYSHLYGQKGFYRVAVGVNMPPAAPADFFGRYNRAENAVYFSWRRAVSPLSLDNYALSLGGIGSVAAAAAAATAHTYQFSNQPAAGKYLFSLFPRNRLGRGDAAVATVIVSPPSPLPAAPAAPQNFAAQPGNRNISFSWSPPSAENNPGEIFGFRILSDGVFLDFPSPTITSYVFDRPYAAFVTGAYSLQAININGAGAAAVITTYAGSAPGVPYRHDGDMRLYDTNGNAAANAGVFRGVSRPFPYPGSARVPVDSWEFEFSAAGRTWTVTTNLTGETVALTVASGLQGGVLHTIRAIAVNRFGKTKGVAGAFMPPVADSLLPSPQNANAVNSGDSAAEIYVSPPLGQSSVQYGYWAGAYIGSSLVATRTVAGAPSQFGLGGLHHRGVRYRIEVATHFNGQVGSARATAYLDTRPAAAANFVARYTDGINFRLSWSHAASPIGLIRYEISNKSNAISIVSGNATVYNYRSTFSQFPVLYPGSYAFTLRAFNASGGGLLAAATAVYIRPPSNFRGGYFFEGKNLSLGWEPPSGLQPISGYRLSYHNRSSVVVTNFSSDARRHNVVVPFGHAYILTLRALIGNAMSEKSVLTLGMPPTKPSGAVVSHGLIRYAGTPGNAEGLTVRWQPSFSHTTILYYVKTNRSNGIAWGPYLNATFAIINSQIGEEINVAEIFAINSHGSSEPLVITTNRPAGAGAPGRPINFNGIYSNFGIDFTWEMPTPTARYFQLRYYNGSGLRVVTPVGQASELPNLAHRWSYRMPLADARGASYFRLRAVDNNIGGGDVPLNIATRPPAPAVNTVVVNSTAIGIDLHTHQSSQRTRSEPPILRYDLSYRGTVLQIPHYAETFSVTGLAPETIYNMSLRARNVYGQGPHAHIRVSTAAAPPAPPRPLPPAPTFNASFVSLGAVSLSWSSPATAVVRGYSLRFNGNSFVLNGADRSTVFSGLPNGVEHVFTLRARGEFGHSGESVSRIVMPPTAPSFVSVYYNDSLRLRVAVGESKSHVGITSYWATYRNITHAIGPDLENEDVFAMSFVNGETYTLTMRALASTGHQGFVGEPAVAVVVMPPAAPSVSVSSTVGVVSLSWSPPASGLPILYYKLLYEGNVQTVGGNADSFVVRRLQNGVDVRFTLFAVNDPAKELVTSNRVAFSVRMPPSAPPFHVMAGDKKLTLFWQPPERLIGGEVSEYIAYVNDAPALTLNARDRMATLAGLANYVSVVAGVAAKNPVGVGARATAHVAPTGLAVRPAAPVSVSVAHPPLDERVALTWGAPKESVRVLSFVLRVNGAATLTLAPSARGATIFGLINGKIQTLELRAKNTVGFGPPATLTAAAQGPPRAPRNITSESRIRSILINGDPSPDEGDSAAYLYRVDTHENENNFERFGIRDIVDINNNVIFMQQGVLHFDVLNLTRGWHNFTVYGINKYGAGDKVVFREYVIPGVPPPQDVRAKTGDRVVTLLWERPYVDDPIIAYFIGWGYYPDNSERYDRYTDVLRPGPFTAIITAHLTNSIEQRFILQAVPVEETVFHNAYFVTFYATPGFPPGAIPFFTASSDLDGSIAIAWGEASNEQGSPLTGYELTYNGIAQTLSATARSGVLDGLFNGQTYSLTLRAASTSGRGPPIVAVATPRAPPTPPTSLAAAGGYGAITVTWGAPQSDNGASVTAYFIGYKSATATVAGFAFTLSNLSAGETVTFAARAANRIGASDAATVSAVSPAPPSAPINLRARRENGAAILTWGAPASLNGSRLLGYSLAYNGRRQSVAANANAYHATALINGEVYLFSLYANSNYGNGATATASAKPATTPATPANLRALSGNGVITLQWDLATIVAQNGGESVTAYLVRYGANRTEALGAVSSVVFSGLTNGETIAFSVYAVNALGESATPATVNEYPSATPGAPSSLRAAAGDGVVTLSWGAPASTGGSPIEEYEARWDGFSKLVSVASVVVSGLTNGRTVTFAVGARNVNGLGAMANVVATPRGAPSAPTDIGAIGASGVITLTWSAPANDNGAAVTGYLINYKGTATATTGRSFVLSGLSSGETVNFTARAVNSVGAGAGAVAQGVEGDNVPSAPTNLRAQRGNGAATLSWGAPARLNDAILQGYEIAYDGQTQSVGASATAYTVTGLTNGAIYQFRVYAKSDRGNGAAAFVSAKPATTPIAPANLRATFADGAITLQWDLATGANTGGEPITAHVVRYGANQTMATGDATFIVIRGLTNGETIAFSVYAANVAGRSAPPATISEYASAAPGAPTGLLAQDGNGVITLQWSAPVNNGGAAITAYIVEYTGGALTTSPSDLRATLTGVANGAPIAVSVFAFNRAGGAASAPINATAATTPAAPANLRAAAGNNAVTLMWNAPANTGGATITAYTAEWGGQSTLVFATSLVVFGFTIGEAAAFTVRARNRKGAGAPASVAFVASGAPNPPTNVAAAGAYGVITLTWDAPVDNGGASVTAYVITYKDAVAAVSTRRFALSNLSAGETVVFTVRAQNSVGLSEGATAQGFARDAPSAPTSLRAQRGNGSVTLTWGAPARLNGSALQGYEVAYGSETFGVGANITGYTVNGLSNGTEYEFRVYAKSDYGNGLAATVSAKPARAPDTPANLRAEFADRAITLRWDLATGETNGGEEITRHIIDYSESRTTTYHLTGETITYFLNKAATVGMANFAVISGLTNGETVSFSVYAVNAAGRSPAPATVSEYPSAMPAAPTFLLAQDGNAVITLQWGASPNDGGATIMGYSVKYTGGALTTSPSVFRATLTVPNGAPITVSVFAFNRVGGGAAAVVTATAATTPDAPASLWAQDNNGVVTLQWSAPANTGGAAVTGYVVEHSGVSITTNVAVVAITGLTNGEPITAKALAINRVGRSPYSAPITATAATTASAPVSLQAMAGDGVVTLVWGAPASDGGASITAYAALWSGKSILVLSASIVVSGLTNGETIAFSVGARNRKGLGAVASVDATPRGLPSAPTSVFADGAYGVVTLVWGAPANNGGATITTYIVNYKGVTAELSGTARGFSVSNLSAGETVGFTVRAVNIFGAGAGAVAEGIARDAPSAPTSLRAIRDDGAVFLAWGPPERLNGAALRGYEISLSGGVPFDWQPQSVGASATAFAVTGLTNDISYVFYVYANSDYGNGATATASATPGTRPPTPANLRAAFADGAVSLQWNLITVSITNPITGYIVRHGANAKTLGVVASVVVDGLTNGETIAFSVYGVNAVGESVVPATISEYPSAPPAAPSGLRSQDGDGVVTLLWGAPASDGGAAVTGYFVEHGGGSLRATATRATLTGLTNGEPTTATIFAINRAGRGADFAAITATAAAPPAAPVSLRAAEGDGAVTLLWSPPAETGGAPLLGYRIVYGGQTLNAGANAPGHLFSGLINGQTITFALRARNRIGLGAAASIAAAGRSEPSAPRGVSAFGLVGNITVTWSAPASDNGASVTGYVVGYKGTMTATPGLSFTLYGLAPGDAVSFTVRAQNSVGLGVAAFAAASLPNIPGAPTGLSATVSAAGNGAYASWNMAWLAPDSDGGATITGYVLTYSEGTLRVSAAGGGGFSSGLLERGIAHVFALRAANVVGLGAATLTTLSAVVAAPEAPPAFVASAFVNGAGASLRWQSQPMAAAATITGYVLTYRSASLNLGNTLAATVGGLTAGEEYAFTLRAGNNAGLGVATFATASLPNVPGAPIGLSAVILAGGASLSWSAPASDGGTPLTGYVLSYGNVSQNIAAAATAALVGGLLGGEAYAFTLRAGNGVGLGAGVSATTALPIVAPDAPLNLRASALSVAARLVWQAPAHNGGASITNYVLSYGAITANMGVVTMTTIGGLTAGELYLFTVRAQNNAGLGAGATAQVVPWDLPSAPTSLSAQRGNGVVTLSWGAPAQLNGAALQGYEIVYSGQTQSVGASATGRVVTGLTNGVTYEFRVYAKSDYGNGAAATTSAKPATTPNAPANLRAFFADRAITLQWDLATIAAENGGELVTAHIVRYGANKAATVGAATSAVIGNLTNGETIAFSVYAVNTVGESAAPATIGEYANTTPGAPTGLQAQDGNGVITLQWSAPAGNGGAAITAYIVEYTGGALTAASNRATITGLSNGAPITATVFAVNRGGRGAASSPITATAATTASAPTGLQAQDGNGVITLQWSAPAGNGGAAVTGYIVEYTGGALTAASNRATITGLSNGAPITATVFAVNRVGRGAASSPITATAATTASAPTGLQAQDGNGVITLQWSAPAGNGGAAVTGYIVEYTGGALTAASNRATITGLSNGAPITATVFAVNRVGRGAASSPITATAATTPGAPTGLQAQDGNGVITLQWSAPAGNGGAAVTGYIVEYTGGALTAASNRATITGLSNGAPITATVFAVNRVGRGAASSPITATAATTPSAPTSLQAAEGDGVVTLTWGAPSNTGGAAVTAYMAEWGGQSTLVSGFSLVVSGLTNGETASFTLRARNRKGLGAAASIAAAGRGKPGAPTAVNAVGSDGNITLTWNAPANDNGAAVTAYIVSYKGTMMTTAEQSFTLSGLSSGETVSFTVQAVNSVGVGAGATAEGVARDAPSAPTNLRAQRGNGVVTLSWGAPAQLNGAALQGYEIVYSGQTQSVGANATGYTATGLSNGADYEFRVYAKSDYGDGAAAITTAKPATTPSAPANLRAFFADRAITLQWSLATGADTGGEPVTAHIVRYGANKAATVGAATSAVIGNLTNGETIAFSVYAVNTVGESAAPATIGEYANTTPGAPTGLQAQDGNGVITLQWSAPAGNGGAAVTGYIVEYTGGALTAASNRATITGLSNGAPITATVFAVNRGGRGAASSPITATAATTSGAPTSLQAQDGNGVITLQWSAPAGNGGAAVTGYIVEYTGGALTAASNRATITGLSNGAPITATVFAVNRVGRGAASSPITATAATTASAPTNLQAAEGDGVVTLTWGAPSNTGGAAVTAYMAEWGGQSTLVSGFSLVVSGLTNGETASFTLRARNRKGLGAAASIAAAGRGKPGAPTAVNAVGSDGNITLTWNAPANDNGAAVTAYIVSYKGTMMTTAEQSFTLSGLSSGETVSFTVQAVNSVGVGAGATAEGVARDAPSAPTNLRAQRGNGVVTLSWGAPAQLNGAALQGYEIVYSGQTQSVGANATGYTATGLSNGADYEFRVYAKSDYGDGAAAITTAKPATTPSAPANLRAFFADRAITLQWSLATGADTGGEPVTAHIVRYGANKAATVGAATSAVIGNLTNGETIAFSVYAVNTVGESAAPATIGEYANTTPGAPTGLQAQDGNGVITLQWSAPAGNGGAAVTGYIVEYTGGALTAASNRATITGLSNGAPITATVFAVNRGGRGAASSPITATAATTPGAPTSLQAAEGDGVVTLTWGAPSNTGGAAVTAYMAEWGGQSTLVSGFLLVVSGLTNGETASFTLRARNRKGLGAAASIAAAGRGKPGAPTAVNAAGSNNSITLTWNAPANDNGAAVTAYIVSYKGIVTAVQGRSFTLSGLSSGETVRFTVQAVNSVGVGAGATAEGVARNAPSAPTNLRAQRGNGVVTLSWGAPARLNGAALQGYEIVYGGQTQSVGANATGYTATGLSNGAEYEFRVYAKSDYGDGAAAITTAKPATTPSAPANLRAGFADSAITLQWSLVTGASAGGEPVTAYIIRYGANRAATVGAVYSVLIDNLMNGETISFSVYAVNAVGESAAPATVGEYPSAPPGAPQSLRAQIGDGAITLQWSAPASNGGAAITAYIVEYTGGALTLTAAVLPAATLTGLTNGEEITMRVFAVNRAGRGAASAPKSEAAATTPSAVTDFFAKGDNRIISLNWNAPNDGGAEITRYVLYVNGAETLAVAGIARSAVLVSLTNGREYTLGIRAENFVGAGPTSQITETPADRPAAPQGFSVAAGNGKMSLYWQAPADGGAPITAYIAFVDGRQAATFAAARQSATLENLTNGKTYTLGLAAANKSGTGAQAMTSATPYTVPDAPKNVYSKKDESGRLTVTWQPASGNGRPVLDYVVSLMGPGIMEAATVDANNFLMARFTVGVSAVYSVYVRARNLAGYGPLAFAVDEEDFRREKEADSVMLPKLAGALSRRWGKALGGRLGAGAGGAGGANLRALGANFSPDDATRGVAELLRKHGGAIANGEKIDESALRNAEFALPLSKGGGGMGAGAPDGAGLWGGASYTNLNGNDGETVWDGEHSNYHTGIDLGLRDNKLVGVMLTRDEIEAKHRAKSGGDYNKYNLSAGGAHPYFLWSAPDGKLRLWAAAGYAKGKAKTKIGETTKTRDLNAYSAFGGFYSLLWSDKSGGVLDLQADVAAARVKVENGGAAMSHNLRMLLEMRREFRNSSGNVFLPFLQAGGRFQDTAAGWETHAGLRWTNAANWRAEISGGASNLYGAAIKQKEWSVEGVLSKTAGPSGKGLSLDLSAQYGRKTKDMGLRGDFWRPLVAEDNAGGGGFGFDAELGYGLMRAGALWRPYFGATFGAGGEYRAGLAWRQLSRADVEARAAMEAKRLRDKTQLNVNMGVNY